jgi:hypothetical protein
MSNNYVFEGNLIALSMGIENAAGTYESVITTAATANRTVTLPDQSGTVFVGSGLSLLSALFSTSGALTVAAGQPVTYSTTNYNNTTIVPTTGVQAPFGASGTTFALGPGVYLISFEATKNGDGGLVLYFGTTLGGVTRVAASAVGCQQGTCQITGNYIIAAPAGGVVAVCSDVGNSTAFAIAANSSTTNASSTVVRFLQIG